MLVFGLVFVLGKTSKPDLFVWKHQTLGRLWIRGFQVWTNPVNDAPATTSSRGEIPSHTRSNAKMTASDSAVSRPYGWKKNFTICKSAAQGSTAKILTAKPLSVEFGERYYMLVFGLVFVLGTTSKPDVFVWRHQTLGRLWIRGFRVWTNPVNDAPATTSSRGEIPSHTRSNAKMTASDVIVFQAIWMKKELHHLQVSCSGEYCKDPDCKNAFSCIWWKILHACLWPCLCTGQNVKAWPFCLEAPDFGEALN